MLTADRSTQTRAEKRARTGAEEEGGEQFDFDKVNEEGSDDDDDDDEGAKLAGKKRLAPPSEGVPAATKKTKKNKSKPLATEKGGPVKEKKKTQRQLDKQAQSKPSNSCRILQLMLVCL